MALHAVDDVDDAFEATRALLFPIRIRRWLKLALVAFFIGSGMNVPTAQFNSPGTTGGNGGTGGTGGGMPSELPPALSENVLAILAIAAIVLVGIWVTFAIVGAIMEFVFVESLRRERVSIREYWSDRWTQGLRLFGFRILIGLPVIAVAVGWLALLVAPFALGVIDPVLSVAGLLVGMALLFVFALLLGLVNGFTTSFVVPIMIQRDVGVLSGWRTLWGSIRSDWKEYVVYAVLAVVLNVVAGLVAALAVGVVGMVLLVPLVVLAAVVHLTVSIGSTIGVAILAVPAALYALVMIVVWATAQVPVLAYMRYYALLVLGDVDESLDLIPDRRDAIRS
ncbi:hypothetical protein ACFQAS_06250 [Halopenitus salinus]|uniref:Glycerophosphoryl diester phosphodiesterase membrane domain-containing protein n=1 Tax=Halopenitus salinus TaxID=1198295 RepID=A0ABD5UWG9_9EURY